MSSGTDPVKEPPLEGRWPALSRAMQDYKLRMADEFSALAYRHVMGGIIRLDDRKRLAKAARRAGIQAFDAQILLACAVRQWSLDQARATPLPHKTTEASAVGKRAMTRFGIGMRWVAVAAIALVLDAIVVCKWLS